MAIVVKFKVTGMSAEKYETVLERLEAAGAGSPPGRLHHVSYGSKDNLQVIDVFESLQLFEAFGATIGPILGELGIEAVPEIEEVHNIVKG